MFNKTKDDEDHQYAEGIVADRDNVRSGMSHMVEEGSSLGFVVPLAKSQWLCQARCVVPAVDV